jgi:diadenosine tetraphosphate (Ap4A) HIT family hydrolase
VGGSTNFVVLPSIGQLGDAHFMIVSRMHETAFTNLRPDLRHELLVLLCHARRWLKAKVGGHQIVFENGDPRGLGRMNCSISHLHVHLVDQI